MTVNVISKLCCDYHTGIVVTVYVDVISCEALIFVLQLLAGSYSCQEV